MFAACMKMCMGHFRQRIRTLTVTVVLMLMAASAVLVAIGFGQSLLYVWLQQIYGTMPALAIIGGGWAALGVILFLIAFMRSGSRHPPVRAVPAAAVPSGGHAIDEAVAAVQQGSRESMVAALVLAVVAGVTLGRKL